MAWNAPNFIALAATLAFLATVSVALRIWAHTKSNNKFGLDDVLIAPALLCVVGMAITLILGTEYGAMAQHQVNEMGPQGPIYTRQLAAYGRANYAVQLLSLASLGFSKTSVLWFYRRVFFVYLRFLAINTVLMVIVVAWAVSFFFALTLQCSDPRTLWTTFEYARINCVDTQRLYYAVAISGFLTDLAILASPLPVIYQLQMRRSKRIAVAGLLLLGALVCGAAIARIVTFVRIGRDVADNFDDLTYFTTPVFVWSTVESALAVVSANLPFFGPLLPQKFRVATELYTFFQTVWPKSPDSEEPTADDSTKEESVRSMLSFELGPGRPRINYESNVNSEAIRMGISAGELQQTLTTTTTVPGAFPAALQWLEALPMSARSLRELSGLSVNSSEAEDT